jgi:hypothetical protein
VGATVIDMHAHVAAPWRGRWVTPATLRHLAHALRSLGYRTVCARPQPEHEHLVRRLGFTDFGEGHILHLYESPCPMPTS